MNLIINYWFVILALVIVVIGIIMMILQFAELPTKKQLQKVKEWLLFAVTEAEAELGSGTGQLKLRTVYDMFLERFQWLAKVISFDTFSELVDEALEEMREMLKNNEDVRNIVGVDEDEL